MIIDIPTGTVLRNTDPDRESFAVLKYKGEQESVSSTKYTPGKTISIGASDEKLALLECYSLNAELDPPATGDTFTVDGLVDTDTLAVLEAAKSVDDAETGARQIAVWAVTDNVDKDVLDNVNFEYQAADITKAKDLLSKAKLDTAKFNLFK